eukprot:gene20682-27477_t
MWSESFVSFFIFGSAILAVVFAAWTWKRVAQIEVGSSSGGPSARDLFEEGRGEEARGTGVGTSTGKVAARRGVKQTQGKDAKPYEGMLEEARGNEAAEIQEAITEGATSFLVTEYKHMGVFMIIMAVFMCTLLSLVTPEEGRTVEDERRNGIFSTIAFLLGALTSCLSGYLGMMIATFANARVALEARKGIAPSFMCAFRSGAVMGFLLAGFGLLNLYLAIQGFKQFFGDDWASLYEAITGFGLGGSSIALFSRVGGGIYTKAADVGADLVGKVEKGIPEDDPRNPAVIAGLMESKAACVIVDIDHYLKMQLIISTVLMTPVSGLGGLLGNDVVEKATYYVAISSLPATFELTVPGDVPGEPFITKTVANWHMFITVAAGLWGGLLIGLQTEYFTSNRYQPVQEVADACRTGAATDIIFGLALGYKSTIIPTMIMCVTIYVSNSLAGMYGIACAALGMLGTLATGLAIDAYGPISDNAGGIAEMAGMGDEVRERTDALDAAGNTTAAIGKGFAIGSAALVSLALFGAYIIRAKIDLVHASILDPKVFAGLLFGSMLPYWFSAMTMKSVGKAALSMVEEVRRQFNTIPGLMEGTARPDYKRCVEISTQASLSEMRPPGALVMLTPIVVGTLFGTQALAGTLAGALVSGVQLAISMSNTGGAWDNAKKYIEAGNTEHARELGGKGSDCHTAAVIGDTVGDPLKDTSGPSLNILIKLMAVESLVFAPFFYACAGGQGLIFKYLGV